MNNASQLGSSLGQLKARAQRNAANSTVDKMKDATEALGDQSKGNESGESSFDKELKDAAEKVEGYMISFMVKQMRKTVKRTEGLFDRGQAEKIFQSRLDDKLSNEMANSKDFGIAEAVYNQFSAGQAR